MIIAIRISGFVKKQKTVLETLHRMRLQRKYAAVLFEDNLENKKLLQSVRNFIAYGPISEKTLEKLIDQRAQPTHTNKEKINAKEVIKQLEKKTLAQQDIKPFFRLHPPRGGIESKKHAGVGDGVLGDNKEKINKLVERML